MRPSSGLQPATRKVAGFRSSSFRPPCIHEAHFRHRGASVSGALRPSATVAAWHPGPAAPLRGKASACLGFARLHPRPGNGGDAVTATPSAASRCSPSLATLSVCLRLCRTDSGGAIASQHCSYIHRRQPLAVVLRFARTRIYYAAVCANACHRPSIHRGSRLGFYRSPFTAMKSSHRLTAARFRSLPGETRLTKGFSPFPPPIRQ